MTANLQASFMSQTKMFYLLIELHEPIDSREQSEPSADNLEKGEILIQPPMEIVSGFVSN